ncbi:PadR family transcriptional regulator [Brevundimonas sp. Root1423]|uniref:PadR family transcriptional regulator n=1 Tax=Brevundimonas sp. Root1423 TaxID=1736462 RepID=UPI0009ECA3E7|nr:PadR family transcriptional regulator [Brevundimonas sp. Root1423]
MIRSRSLSPATRSVLASLAEVGSNWSHGYDLCRATGIKSGTLYPLLIRLESQGHLEAQWLPAETGRPPRHAYRLTAAGHRLAAENPPLTERALSPAGQPA